MNWIKINIELPAGESIKQVKVNGKKLCLIKNNGQLYAVQNTCPHAGGILSGGWCSNGNIVCPIHRYEYNLETGRGLEGQGDYIEKYPLLIKEDGIYVGFKETLWQKVFRKRDN